jgi:ankyrin repeat protein
MLRWVLEGSLGDILAPVTGPLNQLNLAIQHQRNNEITAILQRENIDLAKIGDSGYTALHVACRYGNRFAFELIVGRGP